MKRSLFSAWGWVLVMLCAAVSLLATVLLLVLPHTPLAGEPIALTLHLDGERISLETRAGNVGDALREYGLTLQPQDVIIPAPDTPLTPDLEIIVNRARQVTIILDGSVQTLLTAATSPYEILREAQIEIHVEDRLWLDGTAANPADLLAWTIPVLEIQIRRAVLLTVNDNGTITTFETTARTIGEALFEGGITLYLADIVAPESGTALTQDTAVTITRGMPIWIEVDGEKRSSRVQGGTVGEALAQSGVVLLGLDYVLPPEDTPITADTTIQVVRVTEDIITEESPIPYETLYQADANLELDSKAVVQTGANGIRRVSMRVRYENGNEIGREFIGDETVQTPQNHIIAYGTKIVLRTVDTPAGPREYWRKLRVYATSYHPRALGGDSSTALGMKLEKGMIAADPKLIPWRTNLYVPDYGVGIMGDTGGPRGSRYWIDLGYSDEDYVSWHWYTEVYLLTPVPEDIPYLLPDWSPPH